MEEIRMLSVEVEYQSRRLGGSALLLPCTAL
jgi:hypothetical protein